MTESRFDRYRHLSTQLGEQPARALLDRLQVLALTQPDTLREMEAFIDRGAAPAPRTPVYANPDRRRLSDRRTASMTPAIERRVAVRRASDRSVQI